MIYVMNSIDVDVGKQRIVVGLLKESCEVDIAETVLMAKLPISSQFIDRNKLKSLTDYLYSNESDQLMSQGG